MSLSLLSLYRTKIFIRHPKTLYATEDAFERCKHELGERESWLRTTCLVVVDFCIRVVVSLMQLCGIAATKLQGKYRGYKAKGELKKRKEAGKR